MKRRALVVDDEDIFRESLKIAFERKNYEVKTAVNGKKALEEFIDAYNSGEGFEIVTSDFNMPLHDGSSGMDGLVLYDKLIEIEPNLNFILVSSECTDEVFLSRARQRGVGYTVAKPLGFNDLYGVLDRIYGKKE